MKKVLLLLSALLFFGMVSAQTLVYGLSGFPTTLDSIDSQDGNSLAVSGQITETLVFFEPGTTNLVPHLATESGKPTKTLPLGPLHSART